MPRQRFYLFGNPVMVCGIVILFALVAGLSATATHADMEAWGQLALS